MGQEEIWTVTAEEGEGVPNLCTIGTRLPKDFVIMSLHALRDFAYQTAVL